MIPDKIYVREYPDGIAHFWEIKRKDDVVATIPHEYIRKDALLGWLEQNRNQAQMWFDRYNDREDLSAKQVWEEVIDKLNSM